MTGNDRPILEVLAADGPLAVVDLAAAIDAHPVTVDHVCDRLYERDEVRLIGGQRYEITAAGRRRLADETPVATDPDVRTGTESRP
ncbi:hypothetical protein C478_19127 [Natrinema thermotolerans DSM 11552]|nr:hypothetical protein C478_19127 [Natrinema thermotolerans DSM 11552]